MNQNQANLFEPNLSQEQNATLAIANTDNETEQTWKSVLKQEKQQEYFKNILNLIEYERKNGTVIYPPNKDIFNAFSYTEFSNIKVVILGQDPYHGPGQAHGLSFSVKPGVRPPPSLLNIFKELNADLGIARPKHGCLEAWAKQGVLLLNAVLSVRAGQANSHKDTGWERFTDFVISEINKKLSGVVFLLWGSQAQKKGAFIDNSKHLVLSAPHPSPLSASRGFLGCKHFSKANTYLNKVGKHSISWEL